MTSLELSGDEVQVWVASLRIDDERLTGLRATLAPEERERAATMAPSIGNRFVAARGILRNLLCGFTGVAPQKLHFEYGFNGKPSLADHHIHFNISHSADLAVFAFAPDRAVGIDLENERPVRRLLDVAQRFMTDSELHMLAATPPDQRDATFLKSWVVREARLKAEGKGIWAAGGPRRADLTHKLFVPQQGYIAAVAAPDADWRLYTCAMKD